MYRADAFSTPRETSRRLGPEDAPLDYYRGVELAPKTLEYLVTWDVSGLARCEQDRLNCASRLPRALRGSY